MEEATLAPRKVISNKGIFLLCLGDVSRGMIYGIITTYLLTFFVPTAIDINNTNAAGTVTYSGAGMIQFLLQAGITMAIIRFIGMLFDGISDPIVANMSDRFKSKNGRRIPFMRWSAIPYGLFCILIFFPPVQSSSLWNAVWVCVIMILYYTASTFYSVPFSALQAEITTDPKKRSYLYMISASIYVIASALVYLTSTIKGILIKNGMDVVWAFRVPFIIFIVIGTICAAIPAFCIKENDYVTQKNCSFPIFKSLKETFKYKNFRIMCIGFLVMWIAFGFFNAAMIYDITVILGLPESPWGTVIPGICIAVTLAFYPLVTKLTRKIGKRLPLCIAMGIYFVLYLMIYLCAKLNVASASNSVKYTMGVIIGVLDGLPLAATNTIPPAAIADCAQYDTIQSGERKEGMFMAVKNFCMKICQSIVLLIAPVVITLGSGTDQMPTVYGVGINNLIAAIAAAGTIAIYAFYDEREMRKAIDEAALEKRSEAQ
jgi:glycoside/pentoside/hexuronide:cation symporter, GPH family